MRRVLRSIFVFWVFVGAVSLSAQTADDIVAKHLEAVGGKKAISQVKSLSMQTTTHMGENEIPGAMTILEGVAYRSELDFDGSKMVQCYTANGGWMVNPMAGITVPTPMPADQYEAGKGQIFVGGDLEDYAAKGSKVELLGKDAGSYTVRLTTKENIQTTYVFDAATYLVKSVSRKSKFQDRDVNMTTSLSDYRKTDVGLMLPYAIGVDFGGPFSLSIAVEKVEINPAVAPDICAMPKAAPQPVEGKAMGY